MTIQILGSGCAKCRALEQNARQALASAGLAAVVVKVTDPEDIVDMGVMMTPALALDGEVKEVGKVLSVDEILKIIKDYE